MEQLDGAIDLYCYETIWPNDVIRIKRRKVQSTEKSDSNPTILTVLDIADIGETLLCSVDKHAKYMLAQSCKALAAFVSSLCKQDFHRVSNTCIRLATYCMQTPSLLAFFMKHTVRNSAGEIACQHCKMDNKKVCKLAIYKKKPAQLVQAFNAGCTLACNSLERACVSGVLSSVQTLVAYEKRQQQEYNPLTFTLLRDEANDIKYVDNGFLKTELDISNILVATAQGGNVRMLEYFHLFTDVRAFLAERNMLHANTTVERMYQMAAMCGNKDMLKMMFGHDSFKLRRYVGTRIGLCIGKLMSRAITVSYSLFGLISRFTSAALILCRRQGSHESVVAYLLETRAHQAHYPLATARCLNCLVHCVLEEEDSIFETIMRSLLLRTTLEDKKKIYVAHARCALLCTTNRKSMKMLKTIMSFSVGGHARCRCDAFCMAYVGAHLSDKCPRDLPNCSNCTHESHGEILHHYYAEWFSTMWKTYCPYKAIGRANNKDIFQLAASFSGANNDLERAYQKYLELLFEVNYPRGADHVETTMNVSTHGEMVLSNRIDGVY